VWWVALGWGEPVVPWWGRPDYRGRAHWDGWGGPRVAFDMANYRYHNADLPRAVLTAPDGTFGRERFHAIADSHLRRDDFAPVRGDLPIKPSRFSLYGGAPRGYQPPRDVMSRPVVSTRPPRERSLPWKATGPAIQPQAGSELRIIRSPSRRDEDANTLPRPPFGPQGGQERAPLPLPPRFGEVRIPNKPSSSPLTTRSQDTVREQNTLHQPNTVRDRGPQRSPGQSPSRQNGRFATPPAQPAQATSPPSSFTGFQAPARRETKPRRVEPQTAPPQNAVRQGQPLQTLPGQPANQMYQGQGQRQYRWDQRDGR
jgi:hypothetical protein